MFLFETGTTVYPRLPETQNEAPQASPFLALYQHTWPHLIFDSWPYFIFTCQIGLRQDHRNPSTVWFRADEQAKKLRSVLTALKLGAVKGWGFLCWTWGPWKCSVCFICSWWLYIVGPGGNLPREGVSSYLVNSWTSIVIWFVAGIVIPLSPRPWPNCIEDSSPGAEGI